MRIKNSISNVKVFNFFSTILICVILLEGIFNTLIVSVLPIDNLLGFVLLGLCILCLMKGKMHIAAAKVFLLLVVCCTFIFSFSLGLTTTKLEYFIYFFSFGFAGILGSCLKWEVDRFLEISTLLTIGVTVLFVAKDWYIIQVDYFSFGYMMVPGILCILLYIVELIKKKKIILAVLLGIFDGYVLKVTLGNCGRGVYICFMVFALLALAFLNRYKWTKIICVLAVAAGTLMLVYIEEIVYLLNDFLKARDIEIYAINKCIRLIERMGDITNGRSILWKSVFEDLNLYQILLGRGIGEYEIVNGVYPHNLVLSIFADYGLLGIIGLAIVVVLICKRIINAGYKERYIYILLISVCVAKLMLSSVYWKSSGFWLLVGLGLSKTSVKEALENKGATNKGVKC